MSSKTIAEKLLIKPASKVWLSHPDRVDLIQPLPEGAALVEALESAAVGLVFADSAGALRVVLDANRPALVSTGALWIVYPKANKTDVNRDSLWPILLDYGVRPITQVAVDEVWSALRFRAPKPGEAPFQPGA